MKTKIFIGVIILLGCLLVLFFGLRAFHAFQKFNGHAPQADFPDELETNVEQVRTWMTVPFIARMYGVPEPILYEALGLSGEGNHKKSLEDLNIEYFPEQEDIVIQIIKATLLAHQPPPPPDSPATVNPPSTISP